MEMRVVLEGKQLATGYRKGKRTFVVHRSLDFILRAGELVCLLGGNGVGKSTLLRTLAGVQPALGGELELQGRPLASFSVRERSTAIGLVLTERVQAGGLTVFELAALGRQPYTGYFGRLTRQDKERVAGALEAVGMWPKMRCYVAELSDGERQKVMIAKALVQECPLILLDEPTAFLDVTSRIEVMALLHRLAGEEGKAILMSTHDVEQALALADGLWLMRPDGIMLCGAIEDLVLSGGMDGLFGASPVDFDRMRGSYAVRNGPLRPVRLVAADDVLHHWAQNALMRQGYYGIADSSDATLPLLAIESPQNLTWTCGGEPHRFHSFAELSAALRIFLE